MATAKKVDEFAATGRRKTSVARVRLVKGSGKVIVNGKDVTEYFDTRDMIETVSRPLVLTERADQYDMKASVKGGGKVGQSGDSVFGAVDLSRESASEQSATVVGGHVAEGDSR